MRKAEIKRFVLTFFLKASNILHFSMMTGRLFHRIARVFPKLLLPHVTVLVSDTVSSSSVERNDKFLNVQSHVALYVRRPGIELRPLYDWKPIEWVQDWCYTRSCLRIPVTIQAVKFCTLCRHTINVLRRSYEGGMPQSSRNVIMARASVLQASVVMYYLIWPILKIW